MLNFLFFLKSTEAQEALEKVLVFLEGAACVFYRLVSEIFDCLKLTILRERNKKPKIDVWPEKLSPNMEKSSNQKQDLTRGDARHL